LPAFRGSPPSAKLEKTVKGRLMNDYLAALAAMEMTRSRPGSRRQPARRQPRRAARIAALVRAIAPRRIAVAGPAAA
jgi:hypothetical protein